MKRTNLLLLALIAFLAACEDPAVWEGSSYIIINRDVNEMFEPSGIAIDDEYNFFISTKLITGYGLDDRVYVYPYASTDFDSVFYFTCVGNFRGMDWHNNIAYALGDDPDDIHRYNMFTNTEFSVYDIPNPYDDPRGLALLPNGNVLVVDVEDNKLVEFSIASETIISIEYKNIKNNNKSNLSTCSNSNRYITDSLETIVRIDDLHTNNTHASGLSIDSNLNRYVTDASDDLIYKYDSANVFKNTIPLHPENTNPQGITIKQNIIYVLDNTADELTDRIYIYPLQ